MVGSDVDDEDCHNADNDEDHVQDEDVEEDDMMMSNDPTISEDKK